MEKLEKYLDDVCRRIAGPRAMRAHIKEELREHLTDAIAEHRAAGMTDDEALARAIADFGSPEEVRLELEATHGHRLTGVILDKVSKWKERTMKAKWGWSAAAHLLVFGAIVAEILTIAATCIFILPKFQSLGHDGLLVSLADPSLGNFTRTVFNIILPFARDATWWLIGITVVWALFEWRVRSENKSMIRLASAGVVLLATTVAVSFLMAAMVLPLIIAVPELSTRAPEPVASQNLDDLQTMLSRVKSLSSAQPQDVHWEELFRDANLTWMATFELHHTRSSAAAILALNDPRKADAVRQQIDGAYASATALRDAAIDRNKPAVDAALARLEQSAQPLVKP